MRIVAYGMVPRLELVTVPSGAMSIHAGCAGIPNFVQDTPVLSHSNFIAVILWRFMNAWAGTRPSWVPRPTTLMVAAFC